MQLRKIRLFVLGIASIVLIETCFYPYPELNNIFDPYSKHEGETTLIGEYRLANVITHDLVFALNYVYVACDTMGLMVFDVSDFANPVLITTLSYSGRVSGLWLDGFYLYMTEEGVGLHILNVENPASPSEVGFYSAPDCNSGVCVSGNYAYMSYNTRALVIVDVSDKSNPVLAGETSEPWSSAKVFVQDNYAYLISVSGFAILDVSNVSAPSVVSTMSFGTGDGHGIFVRGNYAYASAAEDGLKIIDISDPTNPEVVFSYLPLVGFLWPSVYVDDRYLYLPTDCPTIFDITNPENPISVKAGDACGCCRSSIAVAGNVIFMAGDPGIVFSIYTFYPPGESPGE